MLVLHPRSALEPKVQFSEMEKSPQEAKRKLPLLYLHDLHSDSVD